MASSSPARVQALQAAGQLDAGQQPLERAAVGRHRVGRSAGSDGAGSGGGSRFAARAARPASGSTCASSNVSVRGRSGRRRRLPPSVDDDRGEPDQHDARTRRPRPADLQQVCTGHASSLDGSPAECSRRAHAPSGMTGDRSTRRPAGPPPPLAYPAGPGRRPVQRGGRDRACADGRRWPNGCGPPRSTRWSARTTCSARAAAAGADRRRPAVVGDPLGPARHRARRRWRASSPGRRRRRLRRSCRRSAPR